MATWWKQLQPYLLVLSLIGNLWLGGRLYNQDNHLNLYTWGNSVDRVWQHLAWVEADLAPDREGRVPPWSNQGLILAREEIEALRSLPHFGDRVADEDLRTLEQFLRYVSESYNVAIQEQGESGTVGAESVRRLAGVREGLNFILTHQERTNQLKSSRNPWNHAAWRAVWHDIAIGLGEMDFVPLPE